MEKCPCIDCPDRGCGVKHDTCERYLKWKESMAKIKESRLRYVIHDAYKKEKDLRFTRMNWHRQ